MNNSILQALKRYLIKYIVEKYHIPDKLLNPHKHLPCMAKQNIKVQMKKKTLHMIMLEVHNPQETPWEA